MSEWKVIYQDVPYSYTDPHVLIVQAENREAAFAVAYDHLSRRGLSVYAGVGVTDDLGIDLEKLALHFGIATVGYHAKTHIRTIEPYTVKPSGQILGTLTRGE